MLNLDFNAYLIAGTASAFLGIAFVAPQIKDYIFKKENEKRELNNHEHNFLSGLEINMQQMQDSATDSDTKKLLVGCTLRGYSTLSKVLGGEDKISPKVKSRYLVFEYLFAQDFQRQKAQQSLTN